MLFHEYFDYFIKKGLKLVIYCHTARISLKIILTQEEKSSEKKNKTLTAKSKGERKYSPTQQLVDKLNFTFQTAVRHSMRS